MKKLAIIAFLACFLGQAVAQVNEIKRLEAICAQDSSNIEAREKLVALYLENGLPGAHEAQRQIDNLSASPGNQLTMGYIKMADNSNMLSQKWSALMEAKASANGYYAKKEVGKAFLRMAIVSRNNEKYFKGAIAQAEALLGKDIISKAIPTDPIQHTAFNRSYDWNNAYEKIHGLIKTVLVGNDDVKPGDKLEINATLTNGNGFSGEEIAVWLGGKWMPTKNGYFSKTIESLTPGHIIVSLGGRTDVKFTVTIQRTVFPEPNWDQLLSSL